MTQETLDQVFNTMRGSGRPEGYYLASKERVPSVTTVNSGLHPQGLFWWHWMNGSEGRAFRDGGTPALEVGTFVHRMVETRIHGGVPAQPPAELLGPIMSAYNAFTRWFEGNKFEVVATEVPLVSEKYRYGGTLDAILRDGEGRLCLGDWKTSKALYSDYLVQVAAYGQLWNENCPEGKELTGGYHLVRFSKENGDMEHRHFPHLDDALEMFLLLRHAYDLDRELKRRVK